MAFSLDTANTLHSIKVDPYEDSAFIVLISHIHMHDKQ